MNAWNAAVERYGPIATGLLLGTICKYGLSAMEGGRITVRGLLIDLSFQGVLGMIAIGIADASSLTGNSRIFVGALVALNSDRIIRAVRDAFFDRLKPPGLGS